MTDAVKEQTASYELLMSHRFKRRIILQKETKLTKPYRVGEWLPSDQKILDNWVASLIEEVDAEKKEFLPVIKEFQEFIESDPEFYMLFNQMFTQVPEKYQTDPVGKPQVRSYIHMLELLNAIMQKAPEYNNTGLVGFPINAILDYAMGTTSGFAAFLNDKVNRQLKKVLNEWAIFLKSKDSLYVLSRNQEELEGHKLDIDKNSWFGTDAKAEMPNFSTTFRCDPTKPYYGFTSWDDFFLRKFKEGQRPIASPSDDSVVVNACESAPLSILENVKKEDKFWIKGQPYSLRHMLANDSFTDRFVGGTIYQAFLSALSYHRWHSPVSGTIIKAYVVEGSYYSEALVAGYDPSAPNDSQRYLTEVAARALIFIEADNKDIGLMCFMAVGMAEVSTCEITVYEGQHVKKGDELGMFHFGGSTHCLIFNPSVNIDFDLHGQVPSMNSTNIPINSKIAVVTKMPSVTS